VTALPRGFRAHVANIGIKDTTADFLVLASDGPAVVAGMFTKSRFAGPSVVLARSAVAGGVLRAFALISKNANVATGAEGEANARELAAGVAAAIGARPTQVLVASTGVIGRQYPMDKIRTHLAELAGSFPVTDAEPCAQAMMTTDTQPKLAAAAVGEASIVGMAKGVGMIEPDMATLIALFVTDARLDQPDLDAVFRRVIERTFNAVSIDTDTSTSDTAAIMANGAAGPVDLAAFERALGEVALRLTKMVARDGEGATKLLEVTVDGARDGAQAKRVAKSIVNSPLVKTAVHGADPNWGRVAMAVGKCSDDLDIVADRVVIRFGDQEAYPTHLDEVGLSRLGGYLRGEHVRIGVSLGIADGTFTVYGCDLSDAYVRINADYTT